MKKLSEGDILKSILKGNDEKTLIDFAALRSLGHIVRGAAVLQLITYTPILIPASRSRMLLHTLQSSGSRGRRGVPEVPDQASREMRSPRIC